MGHGDRYIGSLFRVDEPVPDDSLVPPQWFVLPVAYWEAHRTSLYIGVIFYQFNQCFCKIRIGHDALLHICEITQLMIQLVWTKTIC